jgi:hypothetical protein
MFQVAVRTKQQEEREGRDKREMPPTQIARALGQLGIVWIPAHSPQAKGRIERQFQTAQDRLVKGMRVAGVSTIEEANAYLENEYLPWWEQTLTVEPGNPSDAHRRLGKEHDLAAILSHVETRQVTNDYTVRYQGLRYQIDRQDVRVGLRGGHVHVQQRLDGTVAVRFQEQYLRVSRADLATPRKAAAELSAKPARPSKPEKRKSEWMKNFSIRTGRSLEQAIRISNAKS